MTLSPLKIKLSEPQRQLVQTALRIASQKENFFLDNEVLCLEENTLTVSPCDFIFLTAAIPRTHEAELEIFRLRMLGIHEIERRLNRSTKPSTQAAYAQLLVMAQDTFPIDSLSSLPPRTHNKPTYKPPPTLRLVTLMQDR